MAHHGKTACATCFSEEELCSYVERNGEVGKCDYCERTDVIVLELEDVVAHIEERLRTEYSTADEEGLLWDQEEQRYFPESFDTDEVFDREFGGAPSNDSELQQDLTCESDSAPREGLARSRLSRRNGNH
jgi:hypothetical protein